MALKGISLATERQFSSKYDKGDDKTVFTIGALDSRVYGRLKDSATSIEVDPTMSENETVKTSINTNDVAFDTVLFGLRGWENLQDDKGKPIEFATMKRNIGGKSYKIADPDVVKFLPQAVIMELAEEIRRDNDLSEDDVKN